LNYSFHRAGVLDPKSNDQGLEHELLICVGCYALCYCTKMVEQRGKSRPVPAEEAQLGGITNEQNAHIQIATPVAGYGFVIVINGAGRNAVGCNNDQRLGR
jgi:hypothetical protein